MFLDTIKYFQQTLASLVNNLTDNEKQSIQKEGKKFISKDESLFKKFKECTENDQEGIINYLSSGKGVIPYEMITTFDSLNISPQEYFTIFIRILKMKLFRAKTITTLKILGKL